MDERVPRSRISQFEKPEEAFGGLDVADVAEIVAASSDLTLIIDSNGVISDTAFPSGSIFEEVGKSWIGQSWSETVTVESQPKISALMKDVHNDDAIKWRQVNHMTQSIGDIPVNYATVGLNGSGKLIAVGRDMRTIAEEQRRLMNAQLAMERAYSSLQTSEMRYRQIFQTVGEAVVVVDSRTMKVVEANAAAIRLFGSTANKLEGKRIKDLLRGDDMDVADLLIKAAAAGETVDNVRLMDRDSDFVSLKASMLLDGRDRVIVLKFTSLMRKDDELALPEHRACLDAVKHMPDGFVITEADGRVIMANRAFLDLVKVTDAERLWGDRFDNWFDRSGVDFSVLISNLKEHGAVRRFATAMRSQTGSVENVEIAAVTVSGDDKSVLGFIVRPMGAATRSTSMSDDLLPYSTDQLAGLVGHMSLKDVVRETTSVIERLCIEAALELTGDNRASAAQLLGLSRQSLYDKLNRHGLDK